MFILIFLLGLSTLYLISRDFKITERLALAMPIGLGVTTFLMFFLDQTIHSITSGSVMGTVAVFALLFAGLGLLRDRRMNDMPWQAARPKLDFSWLNLVWVVFAGMAAYLVYGITIKCLYWPPAEFDTIEGYDLLSKAIAREHVIVNSILSNKDIVMGCGPRLLYPPLLTLCNSLCYMTGMDTPKLINALFFVSWSFIIYLLLRRLVSSTNAILFTLLTIVVPEMFAHASFSLTNLPCTIYSTTAVLSLLIWQDQKKEGFFYLSFLSMLFAIWTRSEAIMLAGAVMLVLLHIAITEKRYKYLLIYITTVFPFLAWNIFLKAYVPRAQGDFFIKTLFYDSSKIKEVMKNAWELMSSSNIYGVTFYIFIAALFIGIVASIATNFNRNNKILLGAFVLWLLIVMVVGINFFSLLFAMALFFISAYLNGDRWSLLLIIFVALGAYTALFYQMKEDGTLFSPGGWMQSGYKRGLFCYAPLVLIYASTSKWVNWAFTWLDGQLAVFKKPLA